MSKTLPRWFGQKFKKKNSNKDNESKGTQNVSKASTQNSTYGTNNFLTIRPNYECSRDHRKIMPTSRYDSNSNGKKVENQSIEEIKISPRSQNHSKDVKPFHETKSIGITHKRQAHSSFSQIDNVDTPSIYGGR